MINWLLFAFVTFATPQILMAEEDTPVVHDNMSKDNMQIGHRPFRAPDYSNQEKALGWSPTVFAVPPGLEEQVSFWLDIYTKYTTYQGVFHDSEYIGLIYQELDFSDIENNEELNPFQKERARQNRVTEVRKELTERLKKLHKVKDPETLTGEDLRVWKLFEKVQEKDKFLQASKKGRLRFQLGQKDRFALGIYYSGRYIEEFEEVFRNAGLPIELVRLVFVESSFNIYAQSRVGASGLWQIMPFVGRNELMMNMAVDDRNHPWHATDLAAKILQQNYRMLEDWSFAITGYNHGAYGIRRLARKYQATNLVELLQNAQTRGSFGFASKNFYASFLAALEAEKNASKYFEGVSWGEPLPQAKFTLTHGVKWSELLEWFDGDATKARLFNPHITIDARNGRVHIPPKATIFIESSKSEVVSAALEKFKTENRQLLGPRDHRVVSGDTLSGIAKKYGVGVSEIVRMNNLKTAHQIRVGQVLKIPYPGM